jgi:hypothetical protein
VCHNAEYQTFGLICLEIIQEILTERERKVQFTSLHKISSDKILITKEIFLLFNITSNLNQEVKCTDPSPSVRVPCFSKTPPKKFPEKVIAFNVSFIYTMTQHLLFLQKFLCFKVKNDVLKLIQLMSWSLGMVLRQLLAKFEC